MDKSTIAKLTKQVARKFPEMEGVRPKLKRKDGCDHQPQYELVYKSKVKLPGGKTMSRLVRVIADDEGRILRMSTSK